MTAHRVEITRSSNGSTTLTVLCPADMLVRVRKMRLAHRAEAEELAPEAIKELEKRLDAKYGRPSYLYCSCCGSLTTGRQWHNRDNGYGLCPSCIPQCHRGTTVEEFKRRYGIRGIHYDITN